MYLISVTFKPVLGLIIPSRVDTPCNIIPRDNITIDSPDGTYWNNSRKNTRRKTIARMMDRYAVLPFL